MAKDSMIYLFEWEDICEDLTDEEFGQMIRAVSKYAQTGEKSAFNDRMMKSTFKTIIKAVDRFADKYEAQCERNRENGKKGGRPKKPKTEETQGNPSITDKNPLITHKNPPEPEPEPERGRGRGREREREREAGSPSAITLTTTTQLQEAIVSTWNGHDFVQKIKRVDSPQKRWDRTEMAIEVAGGKKAFLSLLQSLDEHAYLRDQPKNGYKVIYDWFVDPENFQNVLEGKYKDSRDKFGDGWEVVEYE